jgi:hypothetical protein
VTLDREGLNHKYNGQTENLQLTNSIILEEWSSVLRPFEAESMDHLPQNNIADNL